MKSWVKKGWLLITGLLACVGLADEIVIDESYNGGANIAAYQASGSSDPYDGTATVGTAAFSITKGVGSNSSGGLYRQMFYFQLPPGYAASVVTNAVFSFNLNSRLGGPSEDMDIYCASATSLGGQNAAAAIAAYSDSSFADTGLGVTPSSGTVMYDFDVTALVQDAINQGNPTNVIAFRLQMTGDTSLTFKSDDRYIIIGYGIGDLNADKRPELVLKTSSGPVTNEVITIDKTYNDGANIAAYQASDGTDPYDESATGGTAGFQLTKGVGSNSAGGLYRQMFYFQLPAGYTADRIANAVFSFSLNSKVNGPSADMDIYSASAASFGGQNAAAAISTYSDPSFADTGLGLTPSSTVGMHEFDVTALVQDALAQGNPTNVIAFRLQMTDDTSLTFGTDDRYIILGYGIGDDSLHPKLALEVAPAPEYTPYVSWVFGYGLTDTNGNAAMDFDADSDGLENLFEYGVGGDPNDAGDRGHVPGISVVEDAGTNWLYYVHYERTNKTVLGLSYALEAGTDLVSTNWGGSVLDLVGSGSGPDGFNAVTNRTPTDTSDKQFIKLEIGFAE